MVGEKMNKFTILSYWSSCNVGDAIQSIALSKLLPSEVNFIERRDQPHYQPSEDNVLISNGYQCFPLSEEPTVLYSGVYLNDDYSVPLTPFLKGNHFPIGARDPITYRKLKRNAIDSEFVGCVTSTLERYEGVRSGHLQVDLGKEGISNLIPWDMSWEEQWEFGLYRIEQLRKAKSVETNKLHVAMPCLALGTPVKIRYESLLKVNEPERLGLLTEIGFQYDKFNEIDMTPWADRYKDFLYSNLRKIGKLEPQHEPETT